MEERTVKCVWTVVFEDHLHLTMVLVKRGVHHNGHGVISSLLVTWIL